MNVYKGNGCIRAIINNVKFNKIEIEKAESRLDESKLENRINRLERLMRK